MNYVNLLIVTVLSSLLLSHLTNKTLHECLFSFEEMYDPWTKDKSHTAKLHVFVVLSRNHVIVVIVGDDVLDPLVVSNFEVLNFIVMNLSNITESVHHRSLMFLKLFQNIE